MEHGAAPRGQSAGSTTRGRRHRPRPRYAPALTMCSRSSPVSRRPATRICPAPLTPATDRRSLGPSDRDQRQRWMELAQILGIARDDWRSGPPTAPSARWSTRPSPRPAAATTCVAMADRGAPTPRGPSPAPAPCPARPATPRPRRPPPGRGRAAGVQCLDADIIRTLRNRRAAIEVSHGRSWTSVGASPPWRTSVAASLSPPWTMRDASTPNQDRPADGPYTAHRSAPPSGASNASR